MGQVWALKVQLVPSEEAWESSSPELRMKVSWLADELTFLFVLAEVIRKGSSCGRYSNYQGTLTYSGKTSTAMRGWSDQSHDFHFKEDYG